MVWDPYSPHADEYVSGNHVAIARIEELNPFPTGEVAALLASYPNLREVAWVQEEPRNMGAWTFLQPRLATLLSGRDCILHYIGRPEAASPAEGSISDHAAEQNRIVTEAYRVVSPTGKETNGTGKNGRNGSANGMKASAKTGAPVAATTQITEVNSEREGGDTVPA